MPPKKRKMHCRKAGIKSADVRSMRKAAEAEAAATEPEPPLDHPGRKWIWESLVLEEFCRSLTLLTTATLIVDLGLQTARGLEGWGIYDTAVLTTVVALTLTTEMMDRVEKYEQEPPIEGKIKSLNDGLEKQCPWKKNSKSAEDAPLANKPPGTASGTGVECTCAGCVEKNESSEALNWPMLNTAHLNGSKKKGNETPPMNAAAILREGTLHGMPTEITTKKDGVVWLKANVLNRGFFLTYQPDGEGNPEDPQPEPASEKEKGKKAITAAKIFGCCIPEFQDKLDLAEQRGAPEASSTNAAKWKRKSMGFVDPCIVSPGAWNNSCETRNMRNARVYPSTRPLPYDEIDNLPSDFSNMPDDTKRGWVLCFTLIIIGHIYAYGKYRTLATSLRAIGALNSTYILSVDEFNAVMVVLLIITNRILDEKLVIGHKVMLNVIALSHAYKLR